MSETARAMADSAIKAVETGSPEQAIAGTAAIRIAFALSEEAAELKAALELIAENTLTHDACWTARAALKRWRFADSPNAPEWFNDRAKREQVLEEAKGK